MIDTLKLQIKILNKEIIFWKTIVELGEKREERLRCKKKKRKCRKVVGRIETVEFSGVKCCKSIEKNIY